jgi:hypothetical protein
MFVMDEVKEMCVLWKLDTFDTIDVFSDIGEDLLPAKSTTHLWLNLLYFLFSHDLFLGLVSCFFEFLVEVIQPQLSFLSIDEVQVVKVSIRVIAS